jgi:hypothetical protein
VVLRGSLSFTQPCFSSLGHSVAHGSTEGPVASPAPVGWRFSTADLFDFFAAFAGCFSDDFLGADARCRLWADGDATCRSGGAGVGGGGGC